MTVSKGQPMLVIVHSNNQPNNKNRKGEITYG